MLKLLLTITSIFINVGFSASWSKRYTPDSQARTIIVVIGQNGRDAEVPGSSATLLLDWKPCLISHNEVLALTGIALLDDLRPLAIQGISKAQVSWWSWYSLA